MQALQLQISHPILSSMVDPVLSHLDLVFGLRAHIEVEVVTMLFGRMWIKSLSFMPMA
jgi:hypothetical protein